MLDIETIFNGPGPFPTKGSFTTQIDGPALVLVSGTAYSPWPLANSLIGLQVELANGASVNCMVFANEAQSHKTLVTGVTATMMTPGTYAYAITPNWSTVCDENDFATISLWPLPDVPFTWSFSGQLPQYTTISPNIDGTALVIVSGSAWSPDYPQNLGLMVVYDGNPVATTQAWVNVPNSHLAVPTLMAPVMMTPGDHQIGISTVTGDFMTDDNDYYTLAVLY